MSRLKSKRDFDRVLREGREDERARTLLEVQLVAYSLLGFEPDQKYILSADAEDAAAGIIEMTRTATRRNVP